MINLLLTVIAILCFPSFVYADSTDNVLKQKLSLEQKKELAKEMGIILPGMTKQEVRETFGLIEPKIGYSASTGQEVWHYNSPEEQNIYLKDDKVERVEYIPEKKSKQQQQLRQPEEI